MELESVFDIPFAPPDPLSTLYPLSSKPRILLFMDYTEGFVSLGLPFGSG